MVPFFYHLFFFLLFFQNGYENRRYFVTESDLVCGDEWMVDMYQSSLSLGFLIGSFVFGYAADSAAIALTPHFLTVLLLRVILRLGTKGSWTTCYILLTELVGLEQRRLVSIMHQMVICLGIVAMVMLAYFIPDWRWIQVACTAPYALFVLYCW
uniref:Uncharacterized protein n=1 Tax=Knipowitschia caucasica TaxID=637954 RepID=A0AAV2K9L0_KNICA